MNKPTLGGVTMGWNVIENDYCLIESLECMFELCDEVSIAYGGTDGTIKLVVDWIVSKNDEKKIHSYLITEDEWKRQQGREKLSYFSNKAIDLLTTDFEYYQQADEVTHQSSFPYIREAIESGDDAFLVHRLNCWASPYHVLQVEQNRKPVSTEVIRLARKGHYCIGDAESLGASSVSDTVYPIRMYHYGFVRDKHKHLNKIVTMQRDIFLMDYDKRVHDCEDGFDCWKWGFLPTDIYPIQEPLPKFIQDWAADREPQVFRDTEHGLDMAMMYLKHIKHDEDFSIFRYPMIAILHAANREVYRVKETLKNPD